MHSLFITQVYQSKIKTNLASLIEESAQIEKADGAGREWSKQNYHSSYTSYGSWDQLYRLSSEFEKLQKKIDSHVMKYAKSLDYDLPKGALKMNSMWVNIMRPGAQHTAHIHPHSVISGTYYLQTPPGCSSIKFEDPRLGFFMNAPVVKQSAKKANQRYVSLQPRAGDLILFESWLRHEVPRNETKKPRLSVSFNYGWSAE
jgi:uncharacterized protein (TIGR02466 family)